MLFLKIFIFKKNIYKAFSSPSYSGFEAHRISEGIFYYFFEFIFKFFRQSKNLLPKGKKKVRFSKSYFNDNHIII